MIVIIGMHSDVSHQEGLPSIFGIIACNELSCGVYAPLLLNSAVSQWLRFFPISV
jgi:hypothetical protein